LQVYSGFFFPVRKIESANLDVADVKCLSLLEVDTDNQFVVHDDTFTLTTCVFYGDMLTPTPVSLSVLYSDTLRHTCGFYNIYYWFHMLTFRNMTFFESFVLFATSGCISHFVTVT